MAPTTLQVNPGTRRWHLLAGLTLALASLCILAAPASAQPSCSSLNPPLTGAACAQYQGQYGVLSTFATPAYSAKNNGIMKNDLSIVEGIYQNATVGQRNQAAINFNLSTFNPQYNVWNQISPSSQILSTLTAFPQLGTSAPLSTALSSQIPGQTGVYQSITNTLNTIAGFQQVGPLKDSFNSYLTAFQDRTTPYSYPFPGPNPQNPGQNDPRPFQVSNAIASNPWTSSQASAAAIANQVFEWGTPGAGNGFQQSGGFPSGHSTGGDTTALLYAMMLPQAYQSLMVSSQQFGLSRNILGVHHPLDVIGARILTYYTTTQLLADAPNYNFPIPIPGIPTLPAYIAVLSGDLTANLNSTYGNAVTAVPYAGCASNVARCIANGTFPSAAQFAAANLAYTNQATYGFQPVGPTNLAAVVPANANLLIATRFPYLNSAQLTEILATTELPSGGVLDDGSGWVRLNLFKAAGGYGAFNSNVAMTLDASQGGFNAIDMWSNDISGTGGLTKGGTGLLILGGNNSYTGGTTVTQGTLALSGTMVGDLTIQPGASFVSGGGYSVASGATLTNAGTFQSVNASLVNRGTFSNSGTLISDLVNSGTTTNTGTIIGTIANNGNFIQAAGTFANSSALINNGTFTGNVNNTGVLGGNGTFVGTVTNNGIISPGNSIGTLSINGAFTHAAGATYQVETTGAGQTDRINVTGAPGTATLAGGTVAVTGATGVYAPSTTYTILNATGGVTGTYAGVSSAFPFLQPSLSYNANNVFLTLKPGGFGAGAATPNQAAVGRVLDQSVAGSTGDLATVIGTMATYTSAQGQAAMNAISGQNYSGFGSANVGNGLLFMNALGQQMAAVRTGRGEGTRVALAEACDSAEACDGDRKSPWSLWATGMGGTGSIAGNANAGTLTYNAGGFATGVDNRLDSSLLLGAGVGFASGSQWTGGFNGQGSTNSYHASLYASFTPGAFYLDGLAGYGFNDNQMTRQIALPNLAARTAQGRTGANQFLGQVEAGYKVDLHERAAASLTPFARFQATSINQAAFTESGAQSLNLSVAQQTTTSVRTVLGAELAGGIDMGWIEKLALQFRLGWAHEYADTARPTTAALGGAPGQNFTVYGASPQRDSITLGLGASTALAAGTSVYLRYDGEFSTGSSLNALTGGFRMTW